MQPRDVSSNGWVLCLLESVCHSYGWSLPQALHCPIGQLIMLLRQRRVASGDAPATYGVADLIQTRGAEIRSLLSPESAHG